MWAVKLGRVRERRVQNGSKAKKEHLVKQLGDGAEMDDTMVVLGVVQRALLMQRDDDNSEPIVGGYGGGEHKVGKLEQGRSKRSTLEKLRGMRHALRTIAWM